MVWARQIRQNLLYTAQGVTVTLCVVLAVMIILGGSFLLVMAIAPGRFSDILHDAAPQGIHWSVLVAALMEMIYTYLLRLGRLVSERMLQRILMMMGAIAVLSLILGLLALGR